MNLDKTYCTGNPEGYECKARANCARWVGKYEIPENTALWMAEGEIDNCRNYQPLDDLSE